MIHDFSRPSLLPLFETYLKAFCAFPRLSPSQPPPACPPIDCQVVESGEEFLLSDKFNSVECEFTKGAVAHFLDEFVARIDELRHCLVRVKEYVPHHRFSEEGGFVLVLRIYRFSMLKSPDGQLKKLGEPVPLNMEPKLAPYVRMTRSAHRSELVNRLLSQSSSYTEFPLGDLLLGKDISIAPPASVLDPKEFEAKIVAAAAPEEKKLETIAEDEVVPYADIDALQTRLLSEIKARERRNRALRKAPRVEAKADTSGETTRPDAIEDEDNASIQENEKVPPVTSEILQKFSRWKLFRDSVRTDTDVSEALEETEIPFIRFGDWILRRLRRPSEGKRSAVQGRMGERSSKRGKRNAAS